MYRYVAEAVPHHHPNTFAKFLGRLEGFMLLTWNKKFSLAKWEEIDSMLHKILGLK